MEYENLIKTFGVFNTNDLITFLQLFRISARAGDSDSSKVVFAIKGILEKRDDHYGRHQRDRRDRRDRRSV